MTEPRARASEIVRASLSIPARAAAARTTSQSTLGDMPSPHTRLALLIARNTGPCVMLVASVQASTAAFAQAGIGTVGTWPPFAGQICNPPVLFPLLDR